jgi:hypothetical protein
MDNLPAQQFERKWSIKTLIIVLITGCTLIDPGLANATWTVSNYNNATLTSAQINPVTSITCVAESGRITSDVGFIWTQPVTTGNGLVPTTYTLSWNGRAGSGQTTITGLTGSVLSATLTHPGDTKVVVYANYGTWQSGASTPNVHVTTVVNAGNIIGWKCHDQ